MEAVLYFPLFEKYAGYKLHTFLSVAKLLYNLKCSSVCLSIIKGIEKRQLFNALH